MMQKVKKLIYKSLGQSAYLKTLHVFFTLFYKTGLLRKDRNYIYHYFIPSLISEGDYIVDIGANLGYYSKIFSNLVGPEGKVVSVEPVLPFFQTLQWAMKGRKNSTLYNHALGNEKKMIQMSLPKIDDFFRTGLAHVSADNDNAENSFLFDVEMVQGSILLSTMPKIDYIKCDIEGYEEFVIPELKSVLEQHKPILQVETWGEHKSVVFAFLSSIGYAQYGIVKNKLVKNTENEFEGDYIFIHQSKEEAVVNKLKSAGMA